MGTCAIAPRITTKRKGRQVPVLVSIALPYADRSAAGPTFCFLHLGHGRDRRKRILAGTRESSGFASLRGTGCGSSFGTSKGERIGRAVAVRLTVISGG